MGVVNMKGEVADFVDVSQFLPGRSAYECVAYGGGILKYAGEPGHGPTGSALAASNLAQYWYGREEGSTASSNTNGMSLEAAYQMLSGMGLSYHKSEPTIEYVKAWLRVGYPLLICGAETGMVDVGLGDRVPYSWTPTGNHAIVASGIAPDGNLLVHDTANIGPTGVRPGPRVYDASKLQLVSATAIAVPWLPALPNDYDPVKEEDMPISIDLSTPGVATYFSAFQGNDKQWLCSKAGQDGKQKVVQYAILNWYRTNGYAPLCGLSCAGLPQSNEVPVERFSGFEHLAGQGIVVQFFERMVLCYDPKHALDNPPGAGDVYPLHLYNGGPGTDPRLTTLKNQLAQAQAQLQQTAPTVPPAMLADMAQIKAISGKY